MSGVRIRGTVAVLMYHSIAAATTASFERLTVDPALFCEHLAALGENAEVIGFAQVPAALAEGRQAVAITIDDGLADAGTAACPALLRHGLPATLFVPTAFVGASSSWLGGADGKQAMLTWAELGDLAGAGFEIGSHGRQHLAADVHPPGRVRRDAAASRTELEQRLGRPVRSFAYPFGYHAAGARRAVREAGFAQACVVGDLPARTGDDRWALPRLQVNGGTTPEELLAMIRWRPSATMRHWAHAKQHAWHAGRRLAGWGPPEAGRMPEMAR
jgi:peptidoglycan/xylan/chitin deacetylase (PgdA/CDA1 family)